MGRPQKVLDYGDEIRKLDGERIKMVGLVLSLDSYGDRQLPSSNAPHILFCLPSGPKRFLELNCQEPIEFTTESVMATGIFKLRTKGWSGYYPRMEEVRKVAQ